MGSTYRISSTIGIATSPSASYSFSRRFTTVLDHVRKIAMVTMQCQKHGSGQDLGDTNINSCLAAHDGMGQYNAHDAIKSTMRWSRCRAQYILRCSPTSSPPSESILHNLARPGLHTPSVNARSITLSTPRPLRLLLASVLISHRHP